MLKRNQNDDDDVRVQPPSVPTSFLSLPDIAHASIAAFLPDGNDSRLRISEVSRALSSPMEEPSTT